MAETMRGVPFARTERVGVGVVGVGGRGMGLLRNLLACDGADIRAVYDVKPERAARAVERTEAAGQPPPASYTGDEAAWRKLCAQDDLDVVVVATSWEWHVPVAVHAMRQGRHIAVEVPAAVTLDECWQLVDASEATRRHCVILENCCYGYDEMLALNLVRAGVLGEITHAEAAYIHDLRAVLFDESGEGAWRRAPHVSRDGNLYPTHGLGPVARYLDIHRGDRFEVLVSLSSRQASLTAYRDRVATDPDDPRRAETYRCGDMNTSLLRTARGRTVLLQHDVVTPRPYSRLNLVQGTKGAFADYPPRVYVDGETPGHDWETPDRFKERYAPDLWTRMGEIARERGGHGGMDFLMCWRLIEAMRRGEPPDMDVYDAAAWSAPGPLSELSVAQGGMPVPFPDFTRGHWQPGREAGA